MIGVFIAGLGVETTAQALTIPLARALEAARWRACKMARRGIILPPRALKDVVLPNIERTACGYSY